MPYGSKLHIPHTSYHLLAAQQEPYIQKSLSNNILEIFVEKNTQENGPLAEEENDKTKSRTRQKNKRRDRKGEPKKCQRLIRHPWGAKGLNEY